MSRGNALKSEKNILENCTSQEDKVLDITLRPKTWQDYVGQKRVKKNIKIIIEAAKKRNQSPDHLLLYGGTGLGKTTLSCLIAQEMNSNIRITSGPAIERTGDLIAILTNLSDGDILFIDEIHRLNKFVEEYLYSAMEDFKLNIIMGRGPMARTMELKLSCFTLVGATTRLAMLSPPLRNRFGGIFQLNFYELEDIEKIIKRSAKLLGIEIEPEAVKIIAQRSRFTPRVVNRLLRRVRDFAEVEGDGIITSFITKKALKFLEIDEKGLELSDRRVLLAIIEKFNGGPVGLQALAASISEEISTILDIYEPYLLQIGFINRTPRGRTVTELAYQHLNKKSKNSLL